MRREGRYWVAYDLSDDRERSRIEKILHGFGMRVQKSIFECMLGASRLKLLIEKLQRENPKSGFVRIVRLSSAHKNIDVGQSPPNPENDHAWIL